MKRIRYILGFALLLWLLPAVAQSDMTAAEAVPEVRDEADSLAAAPAAPAGAVAETLSPEALWDLANTAYVNEQFDTTINAYEAILAKGLSSAKLYYNLANAYFRQQRLGRAILNYHRALRLAPGDEDIRYNLRVAEARTKDNIESIPEFFLTTWLRNLRHAMSCTAWTVTSLLLLALALTLAMFYLLAQRLSLRKVGFYGTLAALLLFVVATWCAVGERREMLDRSRAVVMSTASAVKSSPDRAATDLFLLHEGTTVKVTDRLENWCQISIADGKKGWIEESKIEII